MEEWKSNDVGPSIGGARRSVNHAATLHLVTGFAMLRRARRLVPCPSVCARRWLHYPPGGSKDSSARRFCSARKEILDVTGADSPHCTLPELPIQQRSMVLEKSRAELSRVRQESRQIVWRRDIVSAYRRALRTSPLSARAPPYSRTAWSMSSGVALSRLAPLDAGQCARLQCRGPGHACA
mgnify:CR=1 FL=1